MIKCTTTYLVLEIQFLATTTATANNQYTTPPPFVFFGRRWDDDPPIYLSAKCTIPQTFVVEAFWLGFSQHNFSGTSLLSHPPP